MLQFVYDGFSIQTYKSFQNFRYKLTVAAGKQIKSAFKMVLAIKAHSSAEQSSM